MNNRQTAWGLLIVVVILVGAYWLLSGRDASPTLERAPSHPVPSDSVPGAPILSPGTRARYSVIVHVRDAISEQPLLDATVHASKSEEAADGVTIAVDDRGQARLNGLTSGRWQLSLSRVGYNTAQLTLDLTGTDRLVEATARLAPTGVIAGRLHGPEGSQGASFRVVLWGPEPSAAQKLLSCSDKGVFEVRHVAPGNYTLRAYAVLGSTVWSGEHRVLGAQGYYEIQLLPSSSHPELADIVGVVKNTKGAPCPKARVWWRLEGSPVGGSVAADENGSFTIPVLPPGLYQVTAHHLFEIAPAAPTWKPNRTIATEPGRPEVLIALDIGSELDVRVTGSDPASVRVTLIPLDLPEGSVTERLADPDGIFRFWGIDGFFLMNVYARTSDGRFAFKSLQHADRAPSVELSLSVGREVYGSVRIPESVDVSTLRVFATGLGSERLQVPADIEGNRFVIRGLVPGMLWRLVASAQAGSRLYEGSAPTDPDGGPVVVALRPAVPPRR